MRQVIAARLVWLSLLSLLVFQPVQAGVALAQVVRSRITVTVPKEDAELLVNNAPARSAGQAVIRTFETEPLDSGRMYTYRFTVKWSPNTYTVITRNAAI